MLQSADILHFSGRKHRLLRLDCPLPETQEADRLPLLREAGKEQQQDLPVITAMQEIKLQDCEQRRRWEWEDVQAELFDANMKSLRLQQTQEAGSIFINEIKNIVITVVAATAVINGQMTLGMMLAVQYIIGQLNSPIEQLMNFIYSLQDVKIKPGTYQRNTRNGKRGK